MGVCVCVSVCVCVCVCVCVSVCLSSCSKSFLNACQNSQVSCLLYFTKLPTQCTINIQITKMFSEKAKRLLTSNYCFSPDVSCFNYCLTQKRPEYELHSQPVPILSLNFLIIFPESNS